MARSKLGLSELEYKESTPRVLFSMILSYNEITHGKKAAVEKVDSLAAWDAF